MATSTTSSSPPRSRQEWAESVKLGVQVLSGPSASVRMIRGLGELWNVGSESDREMQSPSLRLLIRGCGRDGDLTVLAEKYEGSRKSSLESEVFRNPLPYSEYR